MLQCLLCEDWYHEDCLGQVPPSETFDEMICFKCVARHPFLLCLANSLKVVLSLTDDVHVDIETFDDASPPSKRNKPHTTNACCFHAHPDAEQEPNDSSSIFMAQGWRSDLCTCPKCEELLKTNNLHYVYQEEPVYEPEAETENNSLLSYDSTFIIQTPACSRLYIC